MEKMSTYKCTCFALVCNLYGWLASFVGNCKWLVVHIVLDFGLIKYTADKMLDI